MEINAPGDAFARYLDGLSALHAPLLCALRDQGIAARVACTGGWCTAIVARAGALFLYVTDGAGDPSIDCGPDAALLVGVVDEEAGDYVCPPVVVARGADADARAALIARHLKAFLADLPDERRPGGAPRR